MALLQITEPGQSEAPHQRRLAAGIDLGTTNSLIATVRSGVPETLPDANGRHILPSVVQFLPDRVVVGEVAVAAMVNDHANVVSSAKRLIGRSLADLERNSARWPYTFAGGHDAVPRIRTARGDVSAIEVSAEILRTLATRAQGALGGPLVGVVVTVPAYFDDAQRQATKDAARLAGLKVFRLLNEPTAAAIAYGLDRDVDGLHAIFDLGGGTFDISILRLERGLFEVIATGGDSQLGGDDFDRAIADWAMHEAGVDPGEDPALNRQILLSARDAKETLSSSDSVEISLEFKGRAYAITLDREQLYALIDPLIDRTLRACRRALRDAGLTADEIHDVVMVGGSTRMPRVRERVGELFATEPLVDIDPDRVVAIGAAIQADVLAGNKPDSDMLLLDVNPLSLGIETMGGLVEKLIPRNTTIPVSRAQEFTTFKDGQAVMSLHVVQGERELVADCRSLARFELRGIPPMVAGGARVRVTFSVDADGLLNVEAEELSRGVRASVEVKPSYGLTENEISDMLQASVSHAEEDIAARQLAEIRVDAQRVVDALRGALAKDGDILLNSEERQGVEAAMSSLEALTEYDDPGRIQAGIEQLEASCNFYVERRMNATIRSAMAGHRVEEFE